MAVMQHVLSPAEIKEALGEGRDQYRLLCSGFFGVGDCFKWQMVEERQAPTALKGERHFHVLLNHQLSTGAEDVIAALSPSHEVQAEWGMWRFEVHLKHERRGGRLECIVSRREMFDPAYRTVTTFECRLERNGGVR